MAAPISSNLQRATQLIEQLGLSPHPEGGHYRRVYLADAPVTPTDGRATRHAVSTILFLLRAGECSRWHQLDSDEVWTWIEGAPLLLHGFEQHTGVCGEHLLAAPGRSSCVQAVAARRWQSAHSTGAYTLVSCSVAPAFEFADFRFLKDHPDAVAALRARRPEWLQWL